MALAVVSCLGCGSGNPKATTNGLGESDASTGTETGPIATAPTTELTTDGAIDQVSIAVTPVDPSVDVTIEDGQVRSIASADGGVAMPLPFTARAANGAIVTAAWSFDRGDLGSIVASTGEFTASGNLSGTGTITASYAGAKASTSIHVRLRVIQNGRPLGGDASAQGAVGGEGLGGVVKPETVASLRTASVPPANADELGWLYPYDKTVWPKGIAAPLLQWTTTHTKATAVYIHLKQKEFEFEGFYSGTDLVRHPIDPTAWNQALLGNQGDPLQVEIKIADANGVVGPIAERWTVAAGFLKGTVYYNSYRTLLADPIDSSSAANPAAGVLAIKPGRAEPVLALPGTRKRCIVCHEVSDDGSTLFAQEGKLGDDYSAGASYDLLKGGAVIQNYSGTAGDGTTNDLKFVWSSPWSDGTFALLNSGRTPESYGGASGIFRRDNAQAMPAPGFDGVVEQAVTPSFSRDGTKLAFNFWTAAKNAAGGGNGHTLDIMDFVCGPAANPAPGAPTCDSFTFGGLRRLYTNTDTANGFVGWPGWLPDSKGIVFHNTVRAPTVGSPIATWKGAKAELWFTDVPASGAGKPIRLDALNGRSPNGTSYLPKSKQDSLHDDDAQMNYEPTVNPIASGGYYWVVFTSRRMYGNVADGDPYDNGDGTYPITKKLWVAPIDVTSTPGTDPSHPAFYLPGQELHAGNMRGFWVVDPCQADATSCTSGAECCGGFCQPDPTGALLCAAKPQNGSCSQEFEKCAKNDECCGANLGMACINGRCAMLSIVR